MHCPGTGVQTRNRLANQVQPYGFDSIAGLCTSAFAWEINLTKVAPTFALDVRLPVDDYRGPKDLADIRSPEVSTLETNNREYWRNKLDEQGLKMGLPTRVAHLNDLYRISRANILMLADDGEIHPGPTIYDSFWIRDSSVEGIAAALVGDIGLAERQFGMHYPGKFNWGYERIGPVSAHGMFGGEHEKNDHEWDCNGQALWAIGRLDRIEGVGARFGQGLYAPYVVDGARWIRDNRSTYSLMHSGWSAEHIGDKSQPHYWDDFWVLMRSCSLEMWLGWTHSSAGPFIVWITGSGVPPVQTRRLGRSFLEHQCVAGATRRRDANRRCHCHPRPVDVIVRMDLSVCGIL